MSDVNVYAPCDKAIRSMNRWNLEEFGKLKMASWDDVNIIRTVVSVYRKSAKRARKRYKKVAFDAFLIGLALCGIVGEKAEKMAQKAVTDEWVDKVLTETDFVTLYRFDAEAERKAYRLAEALEVTPDRNAEIDKALKVWSKQLGQYAINFTDYAMLMAYADAGVEYIRWVTQKDERVCGECASYDEEVFRIDEIPTKHWGCRCDWVPVMK